MNRRILVSLLIVGAAGATAAGTTFAAFTDTETSPDNTFSAGELDLQVDWEETYNGDFVESQNLTDNPGAIFDISDVKPGDSGEATVSLHIEGNPGLVSMKVNQTANLENGCTEPEAEVDQTCGTPGEGEGELGEYLNFVIWDDDGDNELEEGEEVIFNGTAEELDGNSVDLGEVGSSETEYVGVEWNVPYETGNVIQGDLKKFNFTFHTEQARHNNGTNGNPGGEPGGEPPVIPGNETPVNDTGDTVTVNVMKHICDADVQNLSEFNSVDGPDAGNTTEFHDTVITCPTVVNEDDSYVSGAVNFGEKRDFDFEVTGEDGETQDIDDAQFQQQSINESDIGVDVNGDGDMVDALDTSLYSYTNVSSGLVDVEETEPPEDTRPGALKFTPDALVPNDDAATLEEDLDQVFENDNVIELNTSKDSEDDTVTLHVYNFQDPENDSNVTPPNGANTTAKAISYVELCVNGTKGPGQDTCPDGQRQLVKHEWTGSAFVPEGGAMNTTVDAVEFKENDSSEPVKANWTSTTQLSSVVVKSGPSTCDYAGGSSGTVESCSTDP